MDILKCNICGGTLEINENENIAICEYCGTKQSLPELKYVKSKKKRKNKTLKLLSSITYKFLLKIKALAKKWKLVDKKKKQKAFIMTTSIVCGVCILSIVGVQVTNNYVIPNNKYKKAVFLYNEKRYEEAELLFNQIPQFKNSEEYSNKCVTDMVKNSNVIEFLHKQEEKMSYNEFVKLYGNLSKEEIRYETRPLMPSTWKRKQGKIHFSDIAKFQIGYTEMITSVHFGGTEKMESKFLINQEAYVGGSFTNHNRGLGWEICQHEVDYYKKENTVLSSLYFNVKKEVTKRQFEGLVSYISTYEGNHTDIEYTSDKYTAKWISEQYEYTLTYTIKENQLQYSKNFK